jgi:ribose 5-phosphate isomerase B
MKIFIGADHGGFELKNNLIKYLRAKGHTVEDLGNTVLDPVDDFPDFAKKVAIAVLNDPNSIGILTCRTADGMAITANRFKGIRCSIGLSVPQVARSRSDDRTNILAVSGDFLDFETVKEMVEVFMTTEFKTDPKYLRRIKKIDEI